MKKLSKGLTLLGLTAALILGSPQRAEAGLLTFQANAIGVYQGGDNYWSGQLAWTPKFGIGSLGIRGVLGAALLKNVFGDKFFAVNYELLACIPIFPTMTLEGGGGLATWFDNGGTNPILSANLAFELGGNFLDRLFVGYSRYFLSGNGTNEIKLGVGFNL